MKWEMVRLGDVCGKVASIAPATAFGASRFIYIDIASVNSVSKTVLLSNEISGSEAPSRARQIVESDDVLVSTVRPNLNAVAVLPSNPTRPIIASTGFCVLRTDKEKLHSRYLFYWVRTNAFIRKMIERATGASYPAVSDSIVKSSKIPLPPLPTQQKIAAILDAADALRQKDKALLARYDALLQSTFHQLFGDPVKNEMGWEVKRLGDLIIAGPQNGLYKPSTDYGGGWPILRIDSFYNGIVDDITSLKRVNATDSEKKLFQIYEGDIVINRVNSLSHLGKSAIIPKLDEPTLFESNMMRLEINKTVANPSFLVYQMIQPFFKQLILGRAKNSINQSSINQQDVKSFSIPLPPLSLQTHFATIAQNIQQQKALVKSQAVASEALFQSLLHRAFAGELSV